MKALGVVDYGVGNMRSVVNALNKISVPWEFVSSPREIVSYEKLLLPGVGAFGSAIKRIEESGLKRELIAAARGGSFLLGICLGMQLLSEGSEESPGVEGLGLVESRTIALPVSSVSSNTGFRSVRVLSGPPPVDTSALSRDYYFNHSFQLVPSRSGVVAGSINWNGVDVVAAVAANNVLGVQFHPEKSQGQGLSLLHRFAVAGELAL